MGQAAVLEVEDQRLVKKYYHTKPNCTEQHKDRYVIDLMELVSCFFIMMYAYGVGCSFFILEWTYVTLKLKFFLLVLAVGKFRRLLFRDSRRTRSKTSLPV